MRILHTADWHLGKRLYRQKRDREHAAFLDWLLDTIETRAVDVLIVAGDIFDTPTPSVAAQQQYYHFLYRLGQSRCRHSIIIGGNHDNPAFLDAPGAILQKFNIHVTGAAVAPEKETFVLPDATGRPALIVSAVPYLYERDLRRLEPGEDAADKAEKTTRAIRQHYQTAAEQTRQLRARYGDLPAVATGHLFAAGALTYSDDGVRELYVGTLSRIGVDTFPPEYDYVALGHIHVPQTVAGHAHIRYAGSPIAIGFSEAGQEKQAVLLNIDGRTLEIETVSIPCFQAMARYRGDRDTLIQAVQQHIQQQDNILLELHDTGSIPDTTLYSDLQTLCAQTEVAVLCLRHQPSERAADEQTALSPEILTPETMFARRLAGTTLSPEIQRELTAAYLEILHTLPQA